MILNIIIYVIFTYNIVIIIYINIIIIHLYCWLFELIFHKKSDYLRDTTIASELPRTKIVSIVTSMKPVFVRILLIRVTGRLIRPAGKTITKK